MKKIIPLLLIFCSPVLYAQQNKDVRTNETKIADLLMKLPTQNSTALDAAMQELVAIGEPGYRKLAERILPPGTDKDVAERFAIGSLSKYLGKGNNRAARRSAALALAKAIAAKKNDEAKDFLLQELQYVAGDESVPLVKPYLKSARLADPAARVLVRVNTPLAAAALSNALTTAKGAQQVTLIESLGNLQYAPAAATIQKLYPQLGDANAKKVALYALAKIGDPQSLSLLKNAVSYKPEGTNSANSYLRYLNTIADKGNKQTAATEAKVLLAKNDLDGQFKSAALSLLYKTEGSNARPELLSALSSTDNKYRAGALNLLSQHYDAQTSNELQELIKKTTDPEQQASLLPVFGTQKDKNALPLLTGLLQSNNRQVQSAAVNAIALAGGPEAIDPLIKLMTTGDAAVIPTVKDALLTIKSDALAEKALTALPAATGVARTSLMDIAARRGGQKAASALFGYAADADATTRATAIKALPYVVKQGDEEKIAALMDKTSDAGALAALQKALYTAVKDKGTKDAQVSSIEELMNKSGANRTAYYNVLAGIGGKAAMAVVSGELKNGDARQKEAAVKALAAWSDGTALDALYNISKDPANSALKETALNSYINGINKSDNTLDQKVLQFRNAMDLATTDNQRKMILSGIGNNSSLPALVFVSKYLDNVALQQTAIQAIMSIVLDHTDLYGGIVDGIMDKAIPLNTNGDAAYQKAAWIKQRAGSPKDPGYVSMFNGKDLTGWKGLVGNPITRAKMTPEQLAAGQQKADEQMRKDWKVEKGNLVFEGSGFDNLCSQKMYQDFELFVDWKMEPKGDGGVYLRGSPQVQTWDSSRREVGAQVGSGGLYNNKKNRSTPLVFADNPINEWNTFRIRMVGDKVTVYLNGKLVTDNTTLENYWDRALPIFDKDAIELQAHGTRLEFRDVYVRELERPKPYALSAAEKKEGFVPLFNGVNMDGWTGNTTGYFAQDGMIVCDPKVTASAGTTKNAYTEKEYSNFVMRFEFQLTPAANNGLGIRTPLEGDAAYVGMELQILDNEAPVYKDLHPYQYHGSVYGIIPAKRGFLKPVGEWNYEEVRAVGNHITVVLNGEVIMDGDIAKASKNNTETPDHKQHPGLLNKTGHIGFLGHGSVVKFKNLRIKDLGEK
ncbi:MAG: DUF1080 domain-containing protein [Niabella sp.]|nr:DUF1080 domain-containing protein [Niabella sp.]